MQEHENVRTIREIYDDFTRGNIESVLGRMADDVRWRQPRVPNAPFYSERAGKAQVAEFFAALADAEDVVAFAPREFIAQGDRVVAVGDYRFRVKATSREYACEWVHLFTMRDGLVTSFEEYTDTAAVAAAFQRAAGA